MLKTSILSIITLSASVFAQSVLAANGNPVTESKARVIIAEEIQANPAPQGPKGDTGPQGPQGSDGSDGEFNNINVAAGNGIDVSDQTINLEREYVISAREDLPLIGAPLQGGRVGCLAANGGFYLIVADSDDSPGEAWSNVDTTEIGPPAQSTTSGVTNTTAIIAQSGFTAGAAKVCRDKTSGGYTDWFLPSKDQLNCLYANRVAIGGFDTSSPTIFYWSSTEYSTSNAWNQRFSDGLQGDGGKSVNYPVRCVRAFTPSPRMWTPPGL